uniref:PHD domain-containing protein n=1 Tax=Caenorhabditis tropicalis TaxID=1561998 RepID=A0A1I7T802_9PELO
MLPVEIDKDDDVYVPSGLLSSANNPLGRNSIKANEICEFYNINKPNAGVIEKSSRDSEVFFELSRANGPSVTSLPSAKPCNPLPAPKPSNYTLPNYTSHRVLTLQPGSNPPQLPSDIPKPPLFPTRSYVPRTVQANSVSFVKKSLLINNLFQMRRNIYRPTPFPMPVSTMFPFVNRQMFHSQPLNPYQSVGMMGRKLQQPAIMPPPSPINPNAVFNPAYMPSQYPSNYPIHPMIHPGMMLVSHMHPMMHPMSVFPYLSPFFHKPPEPIMPPEDTKPKISPEMRKQLREEAAAKLKTERLARRAQLKAQKTMEKAKNAAAKRKHDAFVAETGHRKFGNFSVYRASARRNIPTFFQKDMFVIRLKDVDSFDRNNEIWRIDNHILIQKFCGVPSLRAPARQFQSTYKLSGYDSRATWRLFIINPDTVEIDHDGCEVTIHNFPSIKVLREAKQLSEMKDDAFKEIEKSEYEEKLRKSKLKQNSKIEARLKRRFERNQKKLNKEMERSNRMDNDSFDWKGLDDNSVRSSTGQTKISYDDYICRDIMNGLLDALDDEEYDDGESFVSSEEESGFTDEEGDEEEESHDHYQEQEDDEDAGSLISLAHSSDHEHEILYEEHELPAVAFEVVID